MSEEKVHPKLDKEEQKQDHGDNWSNSDSSYSNGSNSQTSVHRQNHRWAKVILMVLASVFIAFVLVMVVGFVALNEISKLRQQQQIAINDALRKEIDELKLNLSHAFEHCKQCNSTIPDSYSYDNQVLWAELEKLRASQNAIIIQLNYTALALSDQIQQVISLRQQTQENFTQRDSIIGGLSEFVTNISEQVSHLHVMRDDHSDQLSQINSNLANFSTQLTHFNGNLSSLSSALEIQKTNITSLTSGVSTLNSWVDVIDRRDTTRDSELEQRISQLGQYVDTLHNDNVQLTNQLNTVDRRLNNLEERSGTTVFYPVCTTMTMAIVSSLVIIILFAF